MVPSMSEQRARDQALALAWHRRVRQVRGGFAVDGSAASVTYLVTRVNGHLACSCPAGERGGACYHVGAVDPALARGREAANRQREDAAVRALTARGDRAHLRRNLMSDQERADFAALYC